MSEVASGECLTVAGMNKIKNLIYCDIYIINNAIISEHHGAKEIYLSPSVSDMQHRDCHLLLPTLSYADLFSSMLSQAQNER
jgi:hypothetical protein